MGIGLMTELCSVDGRHLVTFACMRPGITLATIMKNEARCLERCLRSVKGSVAEIVLVDTGSTDGSQDIARGFEAKVLQTDWPGALDTARTGGLGWGATGG